MDTAQPAVHFLNIEYFFRIIYDLVYGAHTPSIGFASAEAFASELWLTFTVFAYIFSLFCIGALVYYSIRLYQIRAEENQKFATISEPEEHAEVEHSRWAYIRGLVESAHDTDWRQAIIEADIMLDEMLTRQGFVGSSIGDKLKSASPDHFHSLQDAWEAHKVRNEIAHQGSSYELSPNVAYRTIGHYENVFREFGEI